jgi:6-phosphofructokinase 1
MEKFLGDVDRVYSKLGRCLIAVSEGISAPDGKSWAEKMAENLEKDAHGNIQLSGTGALGDFLAEQIKTKLPNPGGKKLRVRADTFGYLQRSFPFVSEVDAREGRLVGQMAVKYSADPKNTEGSIAMRRVGGGAYQIETLLTPLSTVARETKHLDPSYIKEGCDITDAFKDYVRPLVGELPKVGSFEELKKK